MRIRRISYPQTRDNDQVSLCHYVVLNSSCIDLVRAEYSCAATHGQ